MSASGSSSVVLPSFDNTLGPILLGAFASFFLYGITCLQTFLYSQRYGATDSRWLQSLVFALFSLDSFDVVLTAHVTYHYLVSNFADPASISGIVWSVKLHVLVTSLSDFIVRSMFAKRVHRLSHGNLFLTGGIVAISVVDLVVGTVITARAFGIDSFLGLAAVQNLFYVNFATNLGADLYVALVLSYFLWTSRTGFYRTDSVLMTLIVYTVNTGMLTAIDAAAGMITYAVMPTNLVFLAFYLNLSKLYVNCYLASLNARAALLTTMKSGDNGVSIHLSHVSRSMPSFRATGSASAGGGRPMKEFGKEYGYGSGVGTYNAATRSTEDTLGDGRSTSGGGRPSQIQRPRSSASQKLRLGLGVGLGDKDLESYRHDRDEDEDEDDPDKLPIKVDTSVHADLEFHVDREDEVAVALPHVRYGYAQVQTPDVEAYESHFDYRDRERDARHARSASHPYAVQDTKSGAYAF